MQNPRYQGHVKLVLAVTVTCVSLDLVDLTSGWPDWLTVDHPERGTR